MAHGTDGAPKVMCKRCGQILEHPYSLSKGSDGKDQRHGLSTIKRHLTTAGCQKANKGHNTEITKFLRKGVGYTIYNYYDYFANSLGYFRMILRPKLLFRKKAGKKRSYRFYL